MWSVSGFRGGQEGKKNERPRERALHQLKELSGQDAERKRKKKLLYESTILSQLRRQRVLWGRKEDLLVFEID